MYRWIQYISPILFAWILMACESYHSEPFDLSSQSTPEQFQADPVLEKQALNIIEGACFSCHGNSGLGGVSDITNVSHLIETGLIVPGDSTVGRLIGSCEDGSMPQGQSMTAESIAILKNWVDSFEWTPVSDNSPPPSSDPPPPPEVLPELAPNFVSIYKNILEPKCVGCHNPNGSRPKEDYSTYDSTLSTGKINVGNALDSAMFKECESGSMPIGNIPNLSADQLSTLKDWINNGAPE